MFFFLARIIFTTLLLTFLAQELQQMLCFNNKHHLHATHVIREKHFLESIAFTVKNINFNDFLSIYALLLSVFLLSLYWYENVVSLINRKPRKLSLTNNYIDKNPIKVDKEVALHYDTPLTTYEILKIVFFTVTGILFLRILLYLFAVMLGLLFLSIAGWLERNQHPWWFKFWHTSIVVLMHVALFAIGIYHVKTYGEFVPFELCKIIICNHSCVTEVMITSVLSKFPSFVSRRENCKIPLFANAVKTCGMIAVDRSTTSSRQQAIAAIRECAGSCGNTQLLIFPEGTTSNQHSLYMFKKGAFETGQSVQMVCVAFPYYHFNPAWTGRAVGGNNIYQLLLRLCSQFVNYCELRILPVYEPSPYEREDSTMYANHCQRMMATVLRANISDATLHDYIEKERVFALKCERKKNVRSKK